MKRKQTALLLCIISVFLIATLLLATACDVTVTTTPQGTEQTQTEDKDANAVEQDANTDASETNETNDNNETTETTDNNEEETAEFTVTFVTDEHVKVLVYTTQDITGEGVEATSAVARSSADGTVVTDGTGQVNYVLVFDEGYELASVEASPTENFNKNKADPEGTGNANYYRMTKITDDVTVTVTSQETGAEEDLTQGYKVEFVTDGHAAVTVYKTQALTDGTETTVAYSRDSQSGLLTKTNGQVNFVVTAEEGYEILSVEATPTDNYKNLKQDPAEDGSDDYYRITKITDEIVVTITTQAK